MNGGLPEGWAKASIASLSTKVGSGATPRGGSDSYPATGIPLIRSQNVHFDGFREQGLAFLNDRQAQALNGATVFAGDVLLNITGASIGRVCVVPARMNGARVNQHVSIIRTVPGAIAPAFLAAFVSSPESQERIGSEEYGVTRQALTKGWICQLEIPVPPLAEQRRIVEKVAALLARVNVARDCLAKVAGILKRFRQSVLVAAYSGELTEDWRERHARPDGRADILSGVGAEVPADDEIPDVPIPAEWAWVTTESLCERRRAITYGVIKLGPSHENGVPTLRSSDVRPLFIDRTHIKRISRTIADQYTRTCLRGGEVLVTVRGTLGGVAVVPTDMAGHNISREVAQLPVKPTANPDFVMYAIASVASQNWLAERAKGVAYTGINIEDLRRLPLPLPCLEEQQEVVRRLEALLSLASRIERRVDSATARVVLQTEAILAKAFRGALVPTEAELARQEGRDYETASALLERIRAEGAPATSDTAGARSRQSSLPPGRASKSRPKRRG